jgi:hypothetical protein
LSGKESKRGRGEKEREEWRACVILTARLAVSLHRGDRWRGERWRGEGWRGVGGGGVKTQNITSYIYSQYSVRHAVTVSGQKG